MVSFPVNISIYHLKQPRLDVYIPFVYGLEDQMVQQKINNKITKAVQDLIAKQGFYENPQTEITGFFEIKTNQRGVLSLTIEHYSYSGGAHGITYIVGLTFDLETGKSYSLGKLFKKDSNYVSVLSNIISNQIKARDIPVLEPFKSINPNQDFYIADKSLVVYFQLYDLTPYAFGFPYFPISIYKIEDLIKENSPLQKMFG